VSRRFSICFAVIAGIASALLQLKELPLFTESIEQRLVFDPIPADLELLRAIPAHAPGVEEVQLAMPDGVILHGWLRRPERLHKGERYPLVIVYGGVRREISEFVQEARGPGRWGWLMVNYRGFGLSGGVPTERAVLEDSKRVYDWAAAQPDVDAANIVLLGRSLGSYVAVTVAAARRARAGEEVGRPEGAGAAAGRDPLGNRVARGVLGLGRQLPEEYFLAGAYGFRGGTVQR